MIQSKESLIAPPAELSDQYQSMRVEHDSESGENRFYGMVESPITEADYLEAYGVTVGQPKPAAEQAKEKSKGKTAKAKEKIAGTVAAAAGVIEERLSPETEPAAEPIPAQPAKPEELPEGMRQLVESIVNERMAEEMAKIQDKLDRLELLEQQNNQLKEDNQKLTDRVKELEKKLEEKESGKAEPENASEPKPDKQTTTIGGLAAGDEVVIKFDNGAGTLTEKGWKIKEVDQDSGKTILIPSDGEQDEYELKVESALLDKWNADVIKEKKQAKKEQEQAAQQVQKEQEQAKETHKQGVIVKIKEKYEKSGKGAKIAAALGAVALAVVLLRYGVPFVDIGDKEIKDAIPPPPKKAPSAPELEQFKSEVLQAVKETVQEDNDVTQSGIEKLSEQLTEHNDKMTDQHVHQNDHHHRAGETLHGLEAEVDHIHHEHGAEYGAHSHGYQGTGSLGFGEHSHGHEGGMSTASLEFRGDTIWSDVSKQLRAELGYSPSTNQIHRATQIVLSENGLSWHDATHLSVGYDYKMPSNLAERISR